MHNMETEIRAHKILDELHECWSELETRFNLGERISFAECELVEEILRVASDWSDEHLWESLTRDEMDEMLERVDITLDDLRHTIE